MTETARRMRQTFDATGDVWFKRAADELDRAAAIEKELNWIVNYFNGGIRPLDCREWWLRSCEALKVIQ